MSLKIIMIKTILIDDEFKPRELLAIKLAEHCPQLHIVGKASTAQEGFEMCTALQPEIVFLDINMPNETGFDFVKKFDAVPFEIIFVTAHSEFAIDAFRISAVGYILKPIENGDLIMAVNNAIKQRTYKSSLKRYESLVENFEVQSNLDQKLVVPGIDGYEVIKIKNILCFEGTEKYTMIHVDDGRKVLSSSNVGKYKNLFDNHGFFVCHKSYVVNIKFIKTITQDDEIIMTNDLKIHIARRRKMEFMQLLTK